MTVSCTLLLFLSLFLFTVHIYSLSGSSLASLSSKGINLTPVLSLVAACTSGPHCCVSCCHFSFVRNTSLPHPVLLNSLIRAPWHLFSVIQKVSSWFDGAVFQKSSQYSALFTSDNRKKKNFF